MTTMHVRTLTCGEVVTFRMIPEYDLDLRAVIDRVQEKKIAFGSPFAVEGERIAGEQGVVFWEFRLPYYEYEARKKALLSELEAIEHHVREAMKVKSALELLHE